MVITKWPCMILQTMADLKTKHKERVTASMARQEEDCLRQQGADTQLAEKGKALAVAQQELVDTKAASKQAAQVCHSSLEATCVRLHCCHARLLVCSCIYLFQSLHHAWKDPLCAQVDTTLTVAAVRLAVLQYSWLDLTLSDPLPWHLFGKQLVSRKQHNKNSMLLAAA